MSYIYIIGNAKTRWNAPESFPSKAVYEAYMNPEVDASTEGFTWGTPNMDGLRIYANEKLGWEATRLDNELKPVLQAMRGARQGTLVDWIQGKAGAFTSERLKRAANLIKMSKKQKEEDEAVVAAVAAIEKERGGKDGGDSNMLNNDEDGGNGIGDGSGVANGGGGGHMSIIFEEDEI